jgi:arsenite-transporting ATPase
MVLQFSGGDRQEQGDRFLVEMKKVVKKVQGTLTNSQETEFVMVTIPEALAISETTNLWEELRKLQISSHHIIINNVVPHNSCSFCMSRRANQEIYIEHIKKTMKDFTIAEIPLQPQEVKGVALLRGLLQSAFS